MVEVPLPPPTVPYDPYRLYCLTHVDRMSHVTS